MTTATANAWKETTTPQSNPRLSGENHSQASRKDVIWNKLVPIAVKVLCITMKVHTLVHMMKEIEPVTRQTLLRQRTALIGV